MKAGLVLNTGKYQLTMVAIVIPITSKRVRETSLKGTKPMGKTKIERGRLRRETNERRQIFFNKFHPYIDIEENTRNL